MTISEGLNVEKVKAQRGVRRRNGDKGWCSVTRFGLEEESYVWKVFTATETTTGLDLRRTDQWSQF